MSKPTEGPWFRISDNGISNTVGPHWAGLDHWVGSIEKDDNAILVVAAANACMQVNPADPLAAAEAYPAIVEAMRRIKTWLVCPMLDDATIEEMQSLVREALAKIGRK